MKHLLLLVALFSFISIVPCEAGGFCAIAYSEGTHRWGYSDNCESRRQAEGIALRNCRSEDAQIAGWGHNAFVVLARGSGNSWGCGVAGTYREAAEIAINNCPSSGARAVQWVRAFD